MKQFYFSNYRRLFAAALAFTVVLGCGSTALAAEALQANLIYFAGSCVNSLLFNSLSVVMTEEGDDYLYGQYQAPVFYSLGDEESQNMLNAAILLRDNMLQRNGSFSISLSSKSSDYRALVSELFRMAISEELSNSTAAGDYLAWHYGGYSYTGSASEENGIYSYTFNFTVPYYTTAKQEQEVSEIIDFVLEKMKVSQMNTVDVIRCVYDYVCKVCDYDYTSDSVNGVKFSAYGALVQKKAVCQGYSTLLYRMLKECGIDNRIVTSSSHSWNIVNINGKYYNLDATWDDSYYDKGLDYHYFLKCENHFENHKRLPQYTTAEFTKKYSMTSKCMEVAVGNSVASGWKPALATPELSSLTATQNGFTASWSRAVGATGYQLQYSLRSDFSNAGTVKINGMNNLSKTITALKPNTRYYVRIRAYKTENGKTVYSGWSIADKITTNSKAVTANLLLFTSALAITEQAA